MNERGRFLTTLSTVRPVLLDSGVPAPGQDVASGSGASSNKERASFRKTLPVTKSRMPEMLIPLRKSKSSAISLLCRRKRVERMRRVWAADPLDGNKIAQQRLTNNATEGNLM